MMALRPAARSSTCARPQVSATRHLTRQQAANNRRLVENFSFQASSEMRRVHAE